MKTSIASKSAVHPKTTPSEATQAPLSVELVVSGQDPQEFWAIVSAAPTRSWDEVRAALPADYRDMELIDHMTFSTDTGETCDGWVIRA